MFLSKGIKIAPKIELIESVEVEFISTDGFTVVEVVAFAHYACDNRSAVIVGEDYQSQLFLFLPDEAVFSTAYYLQQFYCLVKVELVVNRLSNVGQKDILYNSRFHCLPAIQFILFANLKNQLDAKRWTYCNISRNLPYYFLEIKLRRIRMDFLIESDSYSTSHYE